MAFCVCKFQIKDAEQLRNINNQVEEMKYQKNGNNNKAITTLDYKAFLCVAYLHPTNFKPNQIMMLSKWTTLYQEKENSHL